MIIRVLFCLLLSNTLLHTVSAQKIILATDFGIKANSFENASPAIYRAIESSKLIENATLVLPGGRIDL